MNKLITTSRKLIVLACLFSATYAVNAQGSVVPTYRIFFQYAPADTPDRVELFAINTDGSHLNIVSRGESDAGEIRWSKVESQLYFILTEKRQYGLHAATADGTVSRFVALISS